MNDCREFVGWKAGAGVAVKLPTAQLGRGTLVSAGCEALVNSGLPPGRLEIEATETALLHVRWT